MHDFTTDKTDSKALRDKQMEKRHTKILIEKDEIVVWRRAAKPVVAWCPQCQRETETVTAMQAALLRQVDESRIQEWIHSGHLHASHTSAYGLLICLNSLDLPR
jgi:hypothetical protein